jgi:rubrerythrin
MKLFNLIKSNNWLSSELTLLGLYPDQEEVLDEYRKVFEKLQTTEPAEYDELEIILTEYDCDLNFENEKETYVDVSGQKKIPDPDSITNGYAIEFLGWDKWLGMYLAPETLNKFSELEIIAHCLFEMTFVDYEEEAIQQKFKSISDTVEEYKKLTDEEKNQKTISLEELKKQKLTKTNDSINFEKENIRFMLPPPPPPPIRRKGK